MREIDKIKVWTPLVTPFFDDGTIDYSSLENLVADQVMVGNGILLLGSTGEALSLSVEEKKEIVDFVCKLESSVPILVGVGGYQLDSQLDWLEFCSQYPIAGYLLVTPIYMRPERYGQTAWFQALLNSAQRPCMLYNIPSRSGKSLCPETVHDLNDHPNFWAMKESSGSVENIHVYRKMAPNIRFYGGCDELFEEFAQVGVAGYVPAMANIWPKQVAEYADECLDRFESNPLLKEIAHVYSMHFFKVLLKLHPYCCLGH